MKKRSQGKAAKGTSVATLVETGKKRAPVSSPPKTGGGIRRYLTPTVIYYAVLLLLAAFSLWMRGGFPVYLLSHAGYDDILFLRMAHYLKAGEWLGPYNQIVLTKGMFYSLFVCVVSFFAIPLKVAEQVAYLAAAAITAGLVRGRLRNNFVALVLFGALALNPVLWNDQLARAIREGLYVSLSLAVVTLMVVIAFPRQEQQEDRYARKILLGAVLGCVAGAYWLTREEGIWLVPTLVVVLAIALTKWLQPNWIPSNEEGVFARRSAPIKAVLLPLAVAVVAFMAVNGIVAALNYQYYGIFVTNEFRDNSFLRAYGALTRIQHDEWVRFVPFPKDARQRAYSVSPAARELAPFLDGPLEGVWRQRGCQAMRLNPCDEVLAGWFVWELRDAVAATGHFGSAVEAEHFFDRLADEIDDACARGRISCLPPRATLSPPFRREYISETAQSARAVARFLFTMGQGVVGSAPSDGTPEDINSFADLVHGVYPPTFTTRVIQGWAGAASGQPKILVLETDAQSAHASINSLPAQDLVAANPAFKPIRFRLETDCPVQACFLVVRGANGGEFRVAMSQVVSGAHFETPEVAKLTIEQVSEQEQEATTFEDSGQLKIARVLAAGYAFACPLLTGLGAAGLLLAIILQQKGSIPTSLLALSVGAVAAVLTRIALLSYIDATSFPAANPLYTVAASPFVIVIIVLGIYLGASTILNRIQRRSS